MTVLELIELLRKHDATATVNIACEGLLHDIGYVRESPIYPDIIMIGEEVPLDVAPV